MESISLCMICRDEAQMLPGCLESVSGHVDEIVIVDTGSTDATIEIAKSFGAKVVSKPWVDFSTARNQSLKAASGDWVFILDADEELLTDRPRALQEIVDSELAKAYGMEVINCIEMSEYIDFENSPRFNATKLFKREKVRYTNPIHEMAVFPGNWKTLIVPHVTILHYGYLKEIYEGRAKKTRNSELLDKWVASDPDNPLAKFYFAHEVLMHRNEFAPAADILESTIDDLLDRGHLATGADAYLHLETCYTEMRLPDMVEATFKRGISAYPDHVELRYFFGCFLYTSKHYNEAIAHLRCCLSLSETNPNYQITVRGASSWRALQVLSDAFLVLNDPEKAIVARALADRIHDPKPGPAVQSSHPLLSQRARGLLSRISAEGSGAMDAVEEFLFSKEVETEPSI